MSSSIALLFNSDRNALCTALATVGHAADTLDTFERGKTRHL